ncbi:MAG: insulinase family protein, partial [Proteobacteria bacterium]
SGMKMTDSHYFPFYLGNQAFGGGSFSSRLMMEIRVKRGWSYGAYAYQRFGLEPRTWQAYTFPASKDTPDAVVQLLAMIGDWKRSGITADEFAFNQQSSVNSAGFMYNTPKKRVENILLEQSLNLPDGFFKSYAKEISKLTGAQVNDTVRDFIEGDNLTIFVLGTAKELKPRLAKALQVDEKSIDVIPFQKE